jgi:hypothetical protein
MIESVDPAQCGSYKVHGEHTWRSGWLWRTHNYCPGTNFPANNFDKNTTTVPLTIIEHKHCLRLVKGVQLTDEYFLRKPDDDILWECDWLDCKELFVMNRDIWQEHGVPYDVY